MNNAFLYHLSEIDMAAEWLLSQIGSKKVLLLEAEMGSGKTTLTVALMKLLGCQDEVSSPTYAIVNEYRGTKAGFEKVYHLDLYRIKDIEELEALPITDYLDSGNLCIIEWPDLSRPFLEEDYYLSVQLEVLSDGQRKIVIL